MQLFLRLVLDKAVRATRVAYRSVNREPRVITAMWNKFLPNYSAQIMLVYQSTYLGAEYIFWLDLYY